MLSFLRSGTTDSHDHEWDGFHPRKLHKLSSEDNTETKVCLAVFSYGTLRGDFLEDGDKWGVLKRTGGSWTPGRIRRYKLYQEPQHSYPFVSSSSNDTDVIVGTLLTWPSEDTGILGVRECDRIEGYDPDKPKDGLFRYFVEVELLNKVAIESPTGSERVTAFIYHQHVHAREGTRYFPEGDWLKGLKNLQAQGELWVGCGVRLLEPVRSNNQHKKRRLPIGLEGVVNTIDEDGDAYIDFGDSGRHWIEECNFGKMQVPRPMLQSFDVAGIGRFIIEQRCTRIVVLCGAGISTNAGIPDFQTLYAQPRFAHLPEPKAVFEIDFFRKSPEPFYELAQEIWPRGQSRPTLCHYFIHLLHLKGVLLRCFTQNIDSLELQAGLPENKLVQAHGSFREAHVIDTDPIVSVPAEELDEALQNGRWQKLQEHYGGLVKPKISFYGEDLFPPFSERRHDLEDCDLLIVMGSNLEVSPFNDLVGEASSAAPRLLINRDPVGLCDELENGFRFQEPISNWRDAFYQGDIDVAVHELAVCMGWRNDLEALVAGYEDAVVSAP